METTKERNYPPRWIKELKNTSLSRFVEDDKYLSDFGDSLNFYLKSSPQKFKVYYQDRSVILENNYTKCSIDVTTISPKFLSAYLDKELLLAYFSVKLEDSLRINQLQDFLKSKVNDHSNVDNENLDEIYSDLISKNPAFSSIISELKNNGNKSNDTTNIVWSKIIIDRVYLKQDSIRVQVINKLKSGNIETTSYYLSTVKYKMVSNFMKDISGASDIFNYILSNSEVDRILPETEIDLTKFDSGTLLNYFTIFADDIIKEYVEKNCKGNFDLCKFNILFSANDEYVVVANGKYICKKLPEYSWNELRNFIEKRIKFFQTNSNIEIKKGIWN